MCAFDHSFFNALRAVRRVAQRVERQRWRILPPKTIARRFVRFAPRKSSSSDTGSSPSEFSSSEVCSSLSYGDGPKKSRAEYHSLMTEVHSSLLIPGDREDRQQSTLFFCCTLLAVTMLIIHLCPRKVLLVYLDCLDPVCVAVACDRSSVRLRVCSETKLRVERFVEAGGDGLHRRRPKRYDHTKCLRRCAHWHVH